MPKQSSNPHMRAFCWLACALASCCISLPISGRAALTVDDLTEEQFRVLASLAAPSPTSTGNITNDVAAILDILERARFSTSGRLITVPYVSGTGSRTIGDYLYNGLGEGWSSSSSPRDSAYLYQIRELLKTFPTNYPASDLSWTNAVFDSIERLRSDFVQSLSDLGSDVTTLLLDYDYSSGSRDWRVWLDGYQLDQLLDAISDLDSTTSDGFGDMSYGFDALNSTLAGVGQVDLTPVTTRQDSQLTTLTTWRENDENAADHSWREVQYGIAQQQAMDDAAYETAQDEFTNAYPPDMPAYSPAGDSVPSMTTRDTLLDSLSEGGADHATMLTLINSSDFHAATGVAGDMKLSLAEGGVGQFVGDLRTISRAAWLGLLAIQSALLFWRYQRRIAGIVYDTPLSRVD